jgi:hypothetical protein
MAEDLVSHIRRNKGTLSKRLRTREYKDLRDQEVTQMEDIVGETFEGFD